MNVPILMRVAHRQAALVWHVALACLLGIGVATGASAAPENSSPAPDTAAAQNILFIMLDDVGIDQMAAFGYGGVDKPSLPNLDLIADAGVKFTNVWAMPECSPSRAAFLTGRYPLRTGVDLAILDTHLPQTHVSSYEATISRVLATAGYTSAMVGKYHLGNINPAGDCAPNTRGWDFFSGNMTPGPPSIDTTAGGVADEGTFACGYDQGPRPGACYVEHDAGVTCDFLAGRTPDGATPARTCLQHGGIFTAGQPCQSPPPPLDFTTYNAYYVWPQTTHDGVLPPLATADECPGATTTSREYITTVQSNDGVSWWNAQTGPRMLTVSYNAIHTPYQKPPTSLVADPRNLPLACDGTLSVRLIANRMFEAMDVEIAHLLEGLGLATLDADRKRIVQLHLGKTMLIVVGDNGSFGPTVKPPFDPTRAKGTVYQSGVWVPLIIAGPLVQEPGRSVDHMVNSVDLFQLFGEIAGLDVRQVVPPSHQLDSQSLLPYLTNPQQAGIRASNFTQIGVGTFQTPTNPATRSWPCIVNSNQCSDVLFPTEGFCHDNGGVWYGPSQDGSPARATSCCQALATLPPEQQSGAAITPVAQYGMRNERLKLVQLDTLDCACPLGTTSDTCPPPGAPPAFPWAEFNTKTIHAFYDLTKIPVLNPAGIDRAEDNLLLDCTAPDPAECLPPELQPIFNDLQQELTSLLNSEIPCPGDGNLDKLVDQGDIDGVQAFMGLGPSRFDFNLDAQTDEADLQIVLQHFGTNCLTQSARGSRP
ncbi:MAG: sulfatase-like hydrolase/transferase [Candidatus Entotheonellia bacterium]